MDHRPRFPDRAVPSSVFSTSGNRREGFGQDSAKFSRQPSLQTRKKDGLLSSQNTKSSKLSRTSTFHVSSTDKPQSFQKSNLSRNNFSASGSDLLTQRIRDLQLPAENVEPIGPHGEKVAKKSSSKSSVVETERKERKRRQNTESARRARERKRNEMERLERAYDANEVRIKELELMADELSRELKRHNTISGVPKNRHNNDFKNGEDRPKWFGDAF